MVEYMRHVLVAAALLAVVLVCAFAFATLDNKAAVTSNNWAPISLHRKLRLVDPKTVLVKKQPSFAPQVQTLTRSGGDGGVDDTKRTIWFIGNSVSRINAFAAAEIFGSVHASGLSEEDQKQICGRGGKYKGARPGQGCSGACGCMVSKDSIPRIGFVWQQRMFDDQLRNLLLGNDETYHISEGDIVILNMGYDDIYEKMKFQDIIKKDAPTLMETLTEAQSMGRHVLFRYTTLLCPRGQRIHYPWEEFNDKICISNKMLKSYLEQTDIMHMTMVDDCTMRVDNVHQNQILAKLQVQQMLERMGFW